MQTFSSFTLFQFLRRIPEFIMSSKIGCLNTNQLLHQLCKQSSSKTIQLTGLDSLRHRRLESKGFSKEILTPRRWWRGIYISGQESSICKGPEVMGSTAPWDGCMSRLTRVQWVVGAARKALTWPPTWCSQDAWFGTIGEAVILVLMLY